MDFLVDGAPRSIEINRLVVAGWTGRDKAAVEHHIAELAAIGVKRPRARRAVSLSRTSSVE